MGNERRYGGDRRRVETDKGVVETAVKFKLERAAKLEIGSLTVRFVKIEDVELAEGDAGRDAEFEDKLNKLPLEAMPEVVVKLVEFWLGPSVAFQLPAHAIDVRFDIITTVLMQTISSVLDTVVKVARGRPVSDAPTTTGIALPEMVTSVLKIEAGCMEGRTTVLELPLIATA
ncbi:hypothetical protein MMC20_006564 [Loxospora ochrophaea]|nr:hypothetical protein [Loxospora ochrophaea]